MNRVPTVLIAGLIVALTRSGIARADASQTSSAGADGGSLYVEIGSAGGDLVDHADAAQPAPMVEWIDCGVISDVDSAGAMCRQAAQTCYADRLNDGLPVSGVNDQTHYRVQVTRQADGSWLVTDTSCLIPNVEGQAGPDFAGAAFEEIRRLVPSPRIGVAPAGGRVWCISRRCCGCRRNRMLISVRRGCLGRGWGCGRIWIMWCGISGMARGRRRVMWGGRIRRLIGVPR